MSEDYKDTLYTINKDGNRKWVYPKLIKGRFFYRRIITAYVLIAFYLSLPWITIGGKQAVLLNLAEREFTFFGLTLWATDTIFLVIVLISLALSLFFFTSILGRIWCGWACPETVFLEFVFRPIERLIEGDSSQRLKLDMGRWNFEKFRKKITKHTIQAILAWVLATTALAYFVGSHALTALIVSGPSSNWTLFVLTLVFMGVMGFQFGWFREQFCTVLCPYARFQSVMMDPNTLTIGYDKIRGEPRGKASKKEEDNLGDCVDCGLCVKVCPTGIDIRNGLQLECINCAACIDACDSIMKQLGRSIGLIRYDSEIRLTEGRKEWKILRPRPIIYFTIILGLFLTLTFKLATREVVDLQIVRGASDKTYSNLSENKITNHLHLHISNKSEKDLILSVQVNEQDIELVTPFKEIILKPSEMKKIPLFFNFSKDTLISGKRMASIKVTLPNNKNKTFNVTLLGPYE